VIPEPTVIVRIRENVPVACAAAFQRPALPCPFALIHLDPGSN